MIETALVDDFAEQTALARSALQRAAFEETIERAERLLLLRPAAARLHQLLSVAKAALGRGSAVPATDDASPLVKAALRAALRAQPADHAVCQRLLACVPNDDTERPALEQRVVMLLGVIGPEAVMPAPPATTSRAVAPASETPLPTVVDWDAVDMPTLASIAERLTDEAWQRMTRLPRQLPPLKRFCRRAMLEGQPIAAARAAAALAQTGWQQPVIASAIQRDLIGRANLEEAERFVERAPIDQHGRSLLRARWLVAVGQYEQAADIARSIPAPAHHDLDVPRQMYRSLRSQRRYALAVDFGLDHIRPPNAAPPTLAYDVAMAACMAGSPSKTSDALRWALAHADAVMGTDDEVDDWFALYKFRLRCFDVAAAAAIIERVASRVDNTASIEAERAHLAIVANELASLMPLIDGARRRLRDFADGRVASLGQVDTPVDLLMHMPGRWMTTDPRLDREGADVRPPFFEVLRRVQAEGFSIQLVPQIGTNEFVVTDQGDHLTVAYHAISDKPRLVSIKEADLPHLAYFDGKGYSGWSELTFRHDVREQLQTLDGDDVERFFAGERATVLAGNVSKYAQRDLGAPLSLPDRYVFVALQTSVDHVQTLAHVPMLTMLDWAVERFRGTDIRVVVKRHPRCKSARVVHRMRELAARGEILISDASIHQLIEPALAVFTVNSGVGSEALLHLKPVYLFGRADYRHVCHEIHRYEQLVELSSPLRAPVDDDTIKRFLYWMRRHVLVNVRDRHSLSAAIERRVLAPLRAARATAPLGAAESRPADRSLLPSALGSQSTVVVEWSVEPVQGAPSAAVGSTLSGCVRCVATTVSAAELWVNGKVLARARVEGDGHFALTLAGAAPVAYLWLVCADAATPANLFVARIDLRLPAAADTPRKSAAEPQLAALGQWNPSTPWRQRADAELRAGGALIINGRPLAGPMAVLPATLHLRDQPVDLWLDVIDAAGRSVLEQRLLNDPHGIFRAAGVALGTSSTLQVDLLDGQRHRLERAELVLQNATWQLRGQAYPPSAPLWVRLDTAAHIAPLAGGSPPSAKMGHHVKSPVVVDDSARQLCYPPSPVVLAVPPRRTLPASRRIFVLTHKRTPTEALYVTAPFEALAADGGGIKVRRFDVSQTGALQRWLQHAPGASDAIVVVRYLPAEWLAALLALPQRPRLVYLIDDDLPAAADAVGLPPSYRQRMVESARFDFALMLSACDHLLVTSPGLMRRYRSPKTQLIEPCLLRRPASFAHHTLAGSVRLAYHATASHADDAAFIAPVLMRLVQAVDDLHLDVIVSDRGAGFVADHPRVRLHKQLNWPDYIEHARANPAHAAVVPLLPGPYNDSRSIVKVLDCASLGAAPVLSAVEPYDTRIQHGIDGLLVPNRADAWFNALSALVDDRPRMHALAQANLGRIDAEGALAVNQALWRTVFALGAANA